MTEEQRGDDQGEAKEPASGRDESGDLVFDTLWGRTLADWDDPHTHEALLDYALRSHLLPEAAGRYRSMVGDPGKGELAKKKLDAVVMAATQLLYSTRTPPSGKVPWQITATAFAVCAVLLGWLFLALFRR